MKKWLEERSKSQFPKEYWPEVAVSYSTEHILECIRASAARHGISPITLLAFALHETGSKLDPFAVNKNSGAKGLFQALPAWARDYGLTGMEFDVASECEAAAKSLVKTSREEPYYAYLVHNQGPKGARLIRAAAETGYPLPPKIRRNIVAQPGYKAGDLPDQELAKVFIAEQRSSFMKHYAKAKKMLGEA